MHLINSVEQPLIFGLALAQAGLPHEQPVMYCDFLIVNSPISHGYFICDGSLYFCWELLGYLTYVLLILRQFYHELANSEKAFECLKKLQDVDSRYVGRSICISTIF